ncbi:MAG: heme-binding protein [Moritella sp.]|nr:heme-binding protein [Moritella sp.]
MEHNMKTLKHSVMTLAIAGLMASSFAAAASGNSPKTISVIQISSQSAFELAKEAVQQCEQKGYQVTATVVDVTGNVIAQLRADNAGRHTLESSRQKAFTAASMKQPTAKLMKMIADKPFLQPLKDMDDNLLLLAGGLPLTANNTVIGAIGVGGAPGGHLDVQCAEAAIAKVL